MQFLRKFLALEASGGIILFVAALLALILDNSPLSSLYQKILTTPMQVHVFNFSVTHSLLFWINDGLMTIFFLLIGLELKRECLVGELSRTSQIVLPGVAALGGMAVPVLIYSFINLHDPVTLKGWAVPVATDTAFALGLLSLFGSRVALGLKLFLLTLAIFDDVGAIIIIAIFHTADLSYLSLSLAALLVLTLSILNILGVRSLIPYLLIGFVLWICVLKSGVHTTLAGLVLAFTIPLNRDSITTSPLHKLEDFLLPWVTYLIMPLFAFANAGVTLYDVSFNTLTSPVTLGIIAGLFLGKQIGVFSFAWLSIKLGWTQLPAQARWRELYGVTVLCGVGFTMSLFLGMLAFADNKIIYLIEVRLGVLVGSLLSGIVGVILLSRLLPKAASRG